MNAIICPVCCGRGTIPSQPVGVDLAEEKCHGCGGLGWVSVLDSPAELIEHGPKVSREFVERWMNSFTRPTKDGLKKQIVTLLTEAGVTVKEG